MERLSVIMGDITKQKVDAIVNAANTTLLGGGGVDGAIHQAAGPGLLEECKTLNGCSTGDAKITMGYNLPARYVIHTVGPVWKGGQHQEAELLASCYEKSLELAVSHDARRVAFPSISTGAYGYPLEQAAEIAIKTILGFLQHDHRLNSVVMVCFSQRDYDTYQALVENSKQTIQRD